MLIVETADMLQAPLFTAEALLRAHGNEKCLTFDNSAPFETSELNTDISEF